MIQEPGRAVVHEMVVEMVPGLVRVLEAPISWLFPVASRVKPFRRRLAAAVGPLWPTMAIATHPPESSRLRW